MPDQNSRSVPSPVKPAEKGKKSLPMVLVVFSVEIGLGIFFTYPQLFSGVPIEVYGCMAILTPLPITGTAHPRLPKSSRAYGPDSLRTCPSRSGKLIVISYGLPIRQ